MNEWQFLTDLSINIGHFSITEEHKLENEVKKCASQYCEYIDPEVLKLVNHSVNEAYFRALSTMELALKKTFGYDPEVVKVEAEKEE